MLLKKPWTFLAALPAALKKPAKISLILALAGGKQCFPKTPARPRLAQNARLAMTVKAHNDMMVQQSSQDVTEKSKFASTKKPMIKLTLTPENNDRLKNLCGENNRHLQQIEKYLDVVISNRGHEFVINGKKEQTAQAKKALKELFALTTTEQNLNAKKIHLLLQAIKAEASGSIILEQEKISIRTKKLTITPHTLNQINYIKNILKHDITFSIGPAGTGKTFLAVACAVAALEKEQVNRIILVRPAVEAGERLGFLPGNIAEKVDPYLRPLYDALYETLGAKIVEKLIQENVIEIAPLAFMRGRTLNSAFIILDESQNTTIEQMKMFLTRIGFGSKAVITGDITQIDLAREQKSGLINALHVLKDEPDISFNFFQAYDVVRHPLVQRVIEAYERATTK